MATLELLGAWAGEAQAQDSEIPAVISLRADKTVIGRSRVPGAVDARLDLGDGTTTISRKHLEITRAADGSYWAKDLNSLNGVFINNLKTSHKQLRNGDIVQLGGAAGVPEGTIYVGEHARARYQFREAAPLPPAAASAKTRSPEQLAAKRGTGERAQAFSSNGGGRASSNAAVASRKRSFSARDDGALSVTAAAAAAEAAAAAAAAAKAEAAANELEALQAELGRSRLEVTRLRDDLKRQKVSAAAAVASAEAAAAAQGAAKLLKEAGCAICGQTILDAAVLPCTHAFCRGCWNERRKSKKTAKADAVTCPICSCKLRGTDAEPRGCMQFDGLVASLVAAGASAQERSRWEARERHAAEGVMAADGAGGRAAPREVIASDDESGAEKEADTTFNGVERCPGCQEVGHKLSDCPHRSEGEAHREESEAEESSRESLGSSWGE